MDTSGLRTAVRGRPVESRRWLRLLAAAAVALTMLGGCASAPTELGRPIPVDRLAQLKPGISTQAEVLAVLGEPQGRGGARLPTVPLHDLLLYESDTMEGVNMRMKMLIVFVTRSTGLYEGYLWFNSGLQLSPVN
jgi:hypothetical protein